MSPTNRWLVPLTAILLLLVFSSAATAAWVSSGTGAAGVIAASMPHGQTPNVTSAGGTVTVSWAPSTIGTAGAEIQSLPGGGYTVRRYDINGAMTVVCNTSDLSCTDTVTESGTYSYGLQPTLNSWLGQESQRTSRSVVVDGPEVAITFPEHDHTYSPDQWNGGCTPSGACGTAVAANGTQLESVTVTLQRTSDGAYWNGTAFVGEEIALTADGLDEWVLGLAAPNDGDYLLTALAADDNGLSNQAAAAFTIDSTPPPAQSPTVTLTSPTAGAEFNTALVTYAGTAGDAEGDSATVTVSVFNGNQASGTQVDTVTATRTGTAWSATSTTALDPGTYTARAQQQHATALPGLSDAVTFHIAAPPTTVPSAPTGLTVTPGSGSASGSELVLTWTDTSSNETGFRIERSPNGRANWTEIGTTGANTTTFTEKNLVCGDKRHYRVRGFNSVGNGDYSAAAEGTTVCTPPAAPSNLLATARGGGSTPVSIELTWTDNSANENGFNVERSNDGTTWTPIATVDENVTTFTDSALSCGLQRFYRVRGFQGTVDGPYSNTISATTAACPAAPTGLSATAPSATQVNLTWTDAANNEEGFRIERSTDGATWSQIASVAANVTGYQDTSLSCAVTRHYRVRAFNGLDESAASNTANATTTACTTSVSTTNKAGGTAGRAEQGDLVTIGFARHLNPATVCAGWGAGDASTPATVTLSKSGNSSSITITGTCGGGALRLGTIALSSNYVSGNTDVVFSNSTVEWTATSSQVRITLGNVTGGTSSEVSGNSTATFTPHADLRTATGNTYSASTSASTRQF